MKLSQIFAKLPFKAKALGVVGGLALAGVACTAAAPAAQAQVAFGVAIGGPRVYAPAPRPTYVLPPTYGYGYRYAPGYPYGYGYGWRARAWREHAYWDHRYYGERRYWR